MSGSKRGCRARLVQKQHGWIAFCIVFRSSLFEAIGFPNISGMVLIPLYMFAELGVREEAIKRLL